jgi:acetyl esterase/lipase
MKKALFSLATGMILLINSSSLFANDNPFIKLWSDKTPEAKGTEDKDIPGVQVFLPEADKATGTGILICPGGGYSRICSDHEGVKAAKWLNSVGIAGFVLRYRLPKDGYKHPIPLGDAQRALRLIRANAKKWHLDPQQIGIMGFSAGGHLAAHASTSYTKANPDAKDPVDKVSSRPDFQILVYPCITTEKPYVYRGIFALVNQTKYKKDDISLEKHVTPDTPPAFIVLAGDDGVHPMNSVLFYEACLAKKVPAELHIYRKGGHGFGFSSGPGKPGSLVGTTWMLRLSDWFEQSKIPVAKAK